MRFAEPPLYLSSAALNNDDPLHDDKPLLDDWLRREFAPTAQASRS